MPGGLPGDAVLLLAVRRDVRVLPRLPGLLLLSGERVLEGGRGCTHKQTNADELRRSLHTHTTFTFPTCSYARYPQWLWGLQRGRGDGWGEFGKEGLWGAQLVVF